MKNVRERYKMTELGEIPQEWTIENLENISQLIDGDRSSRYPGDKDITKEGILFLSTQNIVNSKLIYNNSKFISEKKFNELSKGKLEKDDLVITLRGSIGNVAKFNGDFYNTGFINAQLMIVRSNNINANYLGKYLASSNSQKQIRNISSGSAQPQLTKGELKFLKIIVPTIEEQEKIASILSTVDEQINNVDALIEKNKELKKGLMQTLLTKGIGHTKFKKTDIGEIPEEWKVKKLECVFEILDSMRKPIKASDREEIKGDIPYYGASGVIDWVNDYIFDDELVLLGEDGENLNSRNSDLAFKISGKTWVNNHAHVFRVINKKECNIDFMVYYLEAKDYSIYIAGSAQPKITQAQCRKFLLPLPEKQEQDKIASILLEVDEKIEEYESKKQKLEELKKGLMQQLLTGRIRTI